MKNRKAHREVRHPEIHQSVEHLGGNRHAETVVTENEQKAALHQPTSASSREREKTHEGTRPLASPACSSEANVTLKLTQ